MRKIFPAKQLTMYVHTYVVSTMLCTHVRINTSKDSKTHYYINGYNTTMRFVFVNTTPENGVFTNKIQTEWVCYNCFCKPFYKYVVTTYVVLHRYGNFGIFR